MIERKSGGKELDSKNKKMEVTLGKKKITGQYQNNVQDFTTTSLKVKRKGTGINQVFRFERKRANSDKGERKNRKMNGISKKKVFGKKLRKRPKGFSRKILKRERSGEKMFRAFSSSDCSSFENTTISKQKLVDFSNELHKLDEIKTEQKIGRILEEQIKNTKLKNFVLKKRLGEDPTAPFGYEGVNSVVMECFLKGFPEIPLAMKIIFNLKFGKTSDFYKSSDYIQEELISGDEIPEERLPRHGNIVKILHTFRDTLVRESFIEDRHFELFEKGFMVKKTGFIITKKFKETLNQHVQSRGRDNPMSEMEILSIIRGILSGVCHLHKNLIVHRDLKNGNLFLTEKGDVLIGDFGCYYDGKIEREKNSNNGAIFYLPPEVLKGAMSGFSRSVDYSKSDVFSAGLVLYFMMTCGNDNAWGEENIRIDENFIEIESDFSKELRTLVKKMLCCKLEERIQCYEALDIVERVMKKEEKYLRETVNNMKIGEDFSPLEDMEFDDMQFVDMN